jgi:peptidoglycan hydrolase-like protein with peptidoglycan-binding domain
MAAAVTIGSSGPDVGCLERRLAETAANVAPFVVDDVFGPDTDQVVRLFQAMHGLAADGAVGPQTATALGVWSPPPPPPPPAIQPAISSDCTPGYDPCLPPAHDYDCAGGTGNGPAYTGRVRVSGSDPYDLDRNGDGVGCD